jgi:hypothetical protein
MEQKARCRRGRLISERIGQKVRARGPPTMTHHSAVPSLLLPTTTTADHDTVHAPVAVLPIVSQQHGPYLPLVTDTLIATIIAAAIGQHHNIFQLPAVTLGCSDEHPALFRNDQP